ncbi:hypothetical protein [Sulfurimonas sp.]|uniref:hypothetical protein n=1 Tax=Sulfurimonas sp. TaxID=2022749 RepID=UPI0025FA9435|nr:hypothetical protein [Sulfurimonas sp.]MDD5158288.1 hypothetical protein [Sulfurimonas sp.]
MLKTVFLVIAIYVMEPVFADDNRTVKSPVSIGENVFRVNKSRYDKDLEKRYQKDKKNRAPMKIYKRKDGSIDTLKTINEANN